MVVGFKFANSQYRSDQGVELNSAINRASGNAAGSQGAGGGGMSAAQRQQIMNETRTIIEKAKQNPQDVEAQLEAADQFIQIGSPEQAFPFLEQANKVNQSDARIPAGLAMASFMMDKYEDTVTWSKKSIGLNPDNPGATFLLIASYIRLNRNLDEAEGMINQLEARGIEPSLISRAREELAAARAGKPSGAKTMLDHGPENAPAGQGGGKSGGVR